jgi:hypothetical protein
MRSASMLLLRVALLGTVGCGMGQGRAAPPEARTQARGDHPMQGGADWRTRMQQNRNADSSVEQQVRRLTRDLDLTPVQQEKVRQLAWAHHDRIQEILDTAPPTLTRDAFTAQVHAISQDFHGAVNAILTPHQLELMKAMVGRLASGTEGRRAP